MTASKFIFVAVLAAAASMNLAAQDDQSSGPVPVVSSTDQGEAADQQGEAADQQATTPDTQPVTGAQPLTVVSSTLERSYLAPSLSFLQMLDTNSSSVASETNYNTVSTVIGQLRLDKLWKRSRFRANYVGGGTFYETISAQRQFHQFGISQSFTFRRWQLSLFDEASYTPESSFGYWGLTGGYGGFGGVGGLGGFGGSGGLNPQLTPNQSILTAQSSRWSNSTVGQIHYRATSRLSMTAYGGYSLIRSSNPQFVSSHGENFSLGINYLASPKNSLGLQYYNYQFAHSSAERVISQSAQLIFTHHVTDRLALELGGGPQLNSFHGSSASPGRSLSWTLRAGATYILRRGSLGTYYWHSVADGGGVLPAASTHMVQLYYSRHLTRTLGGRVSVGYAHNNSLRAFTSGSTLASFNTEYFGVALIHPLGHQASTFLRYNLQHQAANAVACTALWCGNDLMRHVVGLGVTWHKQPIPLGR